LRHVAAGRTAHPVQKVRRAQGQSELRTRGALAFVTIRVADAAERVRLLTLDLRPPCSGATVSRSRWPI
jgi:hypothetical protein